LKRLANENIPMASVSALREAGYDIVSMTEEAPGSSDEAGLLRAKMEDRVVITFDRDYGVLLFRKRLPPACTG
jgi:predicted nuclease of predicted toxin-antitoxin system